MSEDRKISFKFSADSSSFKNTLNNIKTQMEDLKNTIKNINKQIESSTKNSTSNMKNVYKNLTNIIKNTFSKLPNFAKTGVNKMLPHIKNFGSKAKVVFTNMKDNYIKNSDKMLSSTRNMTSKMGNLFNKLKFAILAAFSVYALYNFGKSAVELASNLEEVQNVVDVSFGSASGEINDFAKNAMKNFGLTELQAKKMSSTFMAMGNGMGIDQNIGKDMAKNLTGMAGDVSSFFNLSGEEAQTALNSIYTGETETLKKLGVVMTETNLKQFALSQGMSTNLQAMSQSEKVILRYNFVMKNLNQASGDFVRTQYSWANQTRILSGLWINFKTIIGNSLKTVFTPLLTVINKILQDLTSLATILNDKIIKANGGISQSASGAVSAASEIGDAYDAAAESIENANAAAAGGLAGFDKINTLGITDTPTASTPSVSMDTGSYGTIGVSPEIASTTQETSKFSAISDMLLGKWEKIKDAFKNAFANADFSRLQTSYANFSDVAGDGFDWLIEKLANFSEWFITEALPRILDLLGAAMPVIMDIVDAIDWEAVGSTLLNMADIIIEVLKQIHLYAVANPEQFQKIVEVMLIIVGIIVFIIPLIVKIIGFIGTIVAIVTFLAPIFEAIGAAIAAVGATTVATVLIVIGIIMMLIGVIGLIYTNWDTIVVWLEKLWETWKTNFFKVIDAIKNFFINTWETMKNNFMTVWNAIKDFFGGIIDGIKNKFDNFVQGIVDKIKFVQDGFIKLGEGIKNIFQAIPDAIKGAINFVIGHINGLLNKFNGLKINLPEFMGGGQIGFDIPNIPELADGGVLSQPTIVKAGEYVGASRNKEIVTPENLMASVFNEQMSPMILLLQQMLYSIQNLSPNVNVQIGEKEVEAIITNLQNKNGYRKNPRLV